QLQITFYSSIVIRSQIAGSGIVILTESRHLAIGLPKHLVSPRNLFEIIELVLDRILLIYGFQQLRPFIERGATVIKTQQTPELHIIMLSLNRVARRLN